jgi:hypothetical protein
MTLPNSQRLDPSFLAPATFKALIEISMAMATHNIPWSADHARAFFLIGACLGNVNNHESMALLELASKAIDSAEGFQGFIEAMRQKKGN